MVFIRGIMMAVRYIQEAVELFQQNNASPHIARFTLDFIEEFDVNHIWLGLWLWLFLISQYIYNPMSGVSLHIIFQ